MLRVALFVNLSLLELFYRFETLDDYPVASLAPLTENPYVHLSDFWNKDYHDNKCSLFMFVCSTVVFQNFALMDVVILALEVMKLYEKNCTYYSQRASYQPHLVDELFHPQRTSCL